MLKKYSTKLLTKSAYTDYIEYTFNEMTFNQLKESQKASQKASQKKAKRKPKESQKATQKATKKATKKKPRTNKEPNRHCSPKQPTGG